MIQFGADIFLKKDELNIINFRGLVFGLLRWKGIFRLVFAYDFRTLPARKVLNWLQFLQNGETQTSLCVRGRRN